MKVFSGNSDRNGIITHELTNPIICRYIRILPTAYHGWVSLRAEFYGCKTGTEVPGVSQWSISLKATPILLLIYALVACTPFEGHFLSAQGTHLGTWGPAVNTGGKFYFSVSGWNEVDRILGRVSWHDNSRTQVCALTSWTNLQSNVRQQWTKSGSSKDSEV